MSKDQVYNLIILDESGSMESIKRPTISGFNEVVQTIKAIEAKFPEQQHFITFITFNGQGIKTLLDRQPVASLAPIGEDTFLPNSSTPLYDAIGHSVLKLKVDLAGNREAKVLVTVLTDGEENSSREYNGGQIKRIIEDQKGSGWTFTYIGANHDVEKAAGYIAITNSITFTANDADVKAMFVKEKKARIAYSKAIHLNADMKDYTYFKGEENDEG
jgi:hypothetical protein